MVKRLPHIPRWEKLEDRIYRLKRTPAAKLHEQLKNELEAELDHMGAELRNSHLVLVLLQRRLKSKSTLKDLVGFWKRAGMEQFPIILNILQSYDTDLLLTIRDTHYAGAALISQRS